MDLNWCLIFINSCAFVIESMNDVNKKLATLLDFDLIIRRLMDSYGFTQVSELLELFKISRQNFANKKKAGTLLPTIIYYAIKNDVDLNWLLTGNTRQPSLSSLLIEINERLTALEQTQHIHETEKLKRGNAS